MTELATAQRDYVCLGDPDFKQRRPVLDEAVSFMRAYSELGRRILGAAQRQGVRFFECDRLKGGGGLYMPGTKDVTIDRKNTVDENAGCVLPHELFHWLQPSIDVYYSWDYHSRILRSLFKEAGAQACAVRVAYEMKLNGYVDAFNVRIAPSSKFAAYAPLYRAFEFVYEEAVASGASHQQALLKGSHRAFCDYFSQPDLINYYGGVVLGCYMRDTVSGENRFSYPIPALDLELAKAQARITPTESLVEDNLSFFVPKDVIFKDNQRLRQALDYVEIVHIAQVLGNNSLGLENAKQATAGNPFFGVGLSKVVQKFDAQKDAKDPKDILEIMIGLAGDKALPTPTAPASQKPERGLFGILFS